MLSGPTIYGKRPKPKTTKPTGTKSVVVKQTVPIMSKTDIGYDNKPLPTGRYKQQDLKGRKKLQKGGLINYKSK